MPVWATHAFPQSLAAVFCMYGIRPVPFFGRHSREGGGVLSDFVGGGEPVQQCWGSLAGGRGKTRIEYGNAERGLAAR